MCRAAVVSVCLGKEERSAVALSYVYCAKIGGIESYYKREKGEGRSLGKERHSH